MLKPTTSSRFFYKVRANIDLLFEWKINGDFWISRDWRNAYLCDHRNFYLRGIFVFVIDGILYPRDRRNFVSSRLMEFLFLRSTNQVIESSDRQIKRSMNQAIDESSKQRIKRSIVSITLKIRDREFSRNWNSGIPGKRSENKKKNPIPPSPQRGTKRPFSRPFFFTNPDRPEKKEQWALFEFLHGKYPAERPWRD